MSYWPSPCRVNNRLWIIFYIKTSEKLGETFSQITRTLHFKTDTVDWPVNTLNLAKKTKKYPRTHFNQFMQLLSKLCKYFNGKKMLPKVINSFHFSLTGQDWSTILNVFWVVGILFIFVEKTVDIQRKFGSFRLEILWTPPAN